MQNPYYTQSAAIRKIVNEQLPNGLETTTDLLLEYMSKSNDEQLRDTAAFIKASKKSEEIGKVFNFAMSLLQHDVTPICEAIYDKGIDGIKELMDHLTKNYGKDENMKANAKAFNFINWLILRLPAKEESALLHHHPPQRNYLVLRRRPPRIRLSSMPSTSQAVLNMCSIVTGMVSEMTSAIGRFST